MIRVPLPLSVENVRQLKTQIKALAKSLNDKVKVDIERAVCGSIAEDVQIGIAMIQDVDGNYLGGDPSAVGVEVGLIGHDVIWRGKQITYLEFGTGAVGAAGHYPGAAMPMSGYMPDPTKTAWNYKNMGHPVTSFGEVPHAPMWNAAMAMRRAGALIPAKRIVEEALRRAVTL